MVEEDKSITHKREERPEKIGSVPLFKALTGLLLRFGSYGLLSSFSPPWL
jgi:hypothetical protein